MFLLLKQEAVQRDQYCATIAFLVLKWDRIALAGLCCASA